MGFSHPLLIICACLECDHHPTNGTSQEQALTFNAASASFTLSSVTLSKPFQFTEWAESKTELRVLCQELGLADSKSSWQKSAGDRKDHSSGWEPACGCQGITAWKKAVMPSSSCLLADLGFHTVWWNFFSYLWYISPSSLYENSRKKPSLYLQMKFGTSQSQTC